jgi:cytochrome c biogenesis protein CcmG/thiol:disulfide interchange protein DsbE
MRKSVNWMPILLLGIFIGSIAFFYTRITAPKWDLPVGQSIPMFTLANVLKPNEVITEEALLGQPAILHVWASWCPNCATEVPILQQIRQKHNTVRWFGVNFKDNLLNAQQWLETHGDSLGMHLYDPNGALSYVLGVVGTPETFVLDCRGKVLYRHAGPLTAELYEQDIAPLLSEPMPCSV